MKSIFSKFVLLIFCFTSAFGQTKNTNERPKLVVGIVVDQMRWDYLYKYYERYSENGFKRMLNEGFSVENTFIPYVPTYTAIGHATVYTGSVPAIHGIAGNDFYIRESQKRMYCTQDDEVKGIGINENEKAGKMSPKNLLTTTLADELKLATDFKSKVIGISMKDRGAILSAGHFADKAYWMKDGKWISSSFYMDKLPNYVEQFNKKDYTQKYLNQEWTTLYPMHTYSQHLADDNPYEGAYIKGEKPLFPINLKKIAKEVGKDLIKTTPFGNTLTLQFAKEILIHESLGKNQHSVPDFLSISLSSPDYIGHHFAINSMKIEDTYLRLDKDLAEFMSFLDDTVGKENYTLFLTADHGAAHNPQFIKDEGGNAGFFKRKEILKELNNQLETEFGQQNLIYAITNNQVFLNEHKIDANKLSFEQIKESAIRFLKKQEGVLFVVDMENANQASIPELIKTRIVNGYNYKRSGDIQLILEPQWYSAYGYYTGTTHGAWNPYDSRIPLIFMGWGIQKGKSFKTAYMTDIAPTLAALLRIQIPNGSIGSPIVEVFK